MSLIGRPQESEYPPYYISYISLIEGDGPLPALEAQVAAFQSLAGLPEKQGLFIVVPSTQQSARGVCHET